MGPLRTDAETQSTVSAGARTEGAEAGARPRRRMSAAAAYVIAGIVLFVAYVRLSETYQLNSDSANILLMGWDMLHGHLLLHGWYMSDVSFYLTELPQYALLEALVGLHMQTAHVAAAMTYTLTFLLAVMLARSGSTGRAAWIRTLIAAGIMLAPEFGLGVFALDLSVGHIGTSVPLLLVWLLLDKAPRQWWVPVATALLLTWALVSDPIVYVVGIGPLGVVGALWVIRGMVRGDGDWMQRIVAQWYELFLGAAAVASVILAWAVNKELSALHAYRVNRLPFYFTNWGNLHNNLPAAWKVLQIFGANWAGLTGFQLVLAFVHLVSVLLVGWALCRVARRFFQISLVDQVLAAAVVLNVVLYMLTNASDEAAHEIAIILPFSAALVARVFIRPAPDRAGALPGRRLRLTAFAAGIAVLATYTAGLGWELAQPTIKPANTDLAAWLSAHHLRYGLSGYWTSSSVTVDSQNKVQVRALMQYTFKPDLWMSDSSWYDSRLHDANFLVLDSEPGYFSHWEPTRLVKEYFGPAAQTYHFGTYTILVYDKNLLNDIPGRIPAPISPGQLSLGKHGRHGDKVLRPVKA